MKKLPLLLLTGMMFLAGCGASDQKSSEEKPSETKTTETSKLVVGGSTSVQPLMEKLTKTYSEKNKADIEVQGGGSTVGFTQTKEGVFQLGMLSRGLSDAEKPEVNEYVIAFDGIVAVVSKENPVSDLSLEQLKDIYTGKITNWKEVGGKDQEINVISREDGSGTRDAFESAIKIKAKDLYSKAQVQNSTGAVFANVKSNPNAIGYISLGSLKPDVKPLTVGKVEATAENIKKQEYKLSRPFLVVTKKDKEDAGTKKFVDFILSEEGQKIVVESKYISVK